MPAQNLQPRDLHPSTVIRASAGTGKTFRLAMRYIGLLARGETPSSLLATTFTKKAAGEMLDRVMKLLWQGVDNSESLQLLTKHADSTLTKERCGELLRLLVANLHRHNVLNIDKLFLRLASGFSLDLGVAPGWKLVDPDEDTSIRIQSLAAMLASRPAREILPTLINLARGGNPSAVHEPILAALDTAYFQFLASKRAIGPWQAIVPESPPLSARELSQSLKSLRASMKDIPLTQAGKPTAHFTNAMEGADAAIFNQDWRQFLDARLTEVLCGDQPYVFSRKEVPDSIREAYLPLIAHSVASLRAELLRKNTALHELLLGFDSSYSNFKSSRGTFVFADIPQLLLDLPYEGSRDHIYYKLDARVRHILLDEFQDTSLQQYELLEPLITECRSSDDGRTMFIVGDTKQSLYGWRGAEPALLGQLDKHLSMTPETLVLNFRSSPIIIDAVNTVFSGLVSNQAFIDKGASTAADWQSTFSAHESQKHSLPGEASLIVAPQASETSEVSDRDMLLTHTVHRVKLAYDRSEHASIAILVRTNKWLAPLRFALSKLGIESSEEGGGPLTDSAAVRAVLSLFHIASHPGDTVACYHVARSPLGPLVGLKDFRSKSQALAISHRIRSNVLSRGVTPAILSLRTKLLPSLTVRDHARLTQLITLAAKFDAQGSRDPAAFYSFASSQNIEDPNPARVRLMSIHKAKGLEFDAVFLPQFDNAWKSKGQEILVSRESPFQPPNLLSMAPPKELSDTDPQISSLKAAQFERLVGEELCCLYVGMTRAIHHLEIIVTPAKPQNGGSPSSARILCHALAPVTPRDPDTTLYSKANGDWAAWLNERSMPSPAMPAPIPLTLTKSTSIHPLRLARTSPSSLESPASPSIAELLQPRHDASLDRGTLIHAWFELIEWSDGPAPTDDELLSHAARFGIKAMEALPRLPEFRSMLAHPAIKTALARPTGSSGNWSLKREWPFSVQITHNERPTMLTGRFDRVHIRFENGIPVESQILDFKTDALITSSLQNSTETYRPQMAAYRSALAVLLKLDPADIRASLLFVSTGQVVPI